MGYSGDAPSRQNQWSLRDEDVAPSVDREDTHVLRGAVELHRANRRRRELFNHDVMADAPMDIMLTALIAREQNSVLTRQAAAMANGIAHVHADAVIDDLIIIRLLTAGNRRDEIGLTQLGADLMREFVIRPD